MKAIEERLRVNGQFRSIIVRRRNGKTDMVLCGHHVRDAMVMNGGSVVRAEIVECDDDTAKRAHIADNRTGDLPTFDADALIAQLDGFGYDFTGTGFTVAKADKLMFKGMPELGDASTDDETGDRWGVVIEIGTEQEQAELLSG